MKSKIYAFLLFFFLGLNYTLAGGIECVTWSGGYISEGEEPDYFVRY